MTVTSIFSLTPTALLPAFCPEARAIVLEHRCNDVILPKLSGFLLPTRFKHTLNLAHKGPHELAPAYPMPPLTSCKILALPPKFSLYLHFLVYKIGAYYSRWHFPKTSAVIHTPFHEFFSQGHGLSPWEVLSFNLGRLWPRPWRINSYG